MILLDVADDADGVEIGLGCMLKLGEVVMMVLIEIG
jgi:hypothetical protein